MHGSQPRTAQPPRTRRAAVAVALAALVLVLVVAAGATLVRVMGGDAGPAEIVLTTNDFEFSDRQLVTSSRTVELTLANVDGVTHTFTIGELDVDLVVGAGEARSLTFDVAKGRYRFTCTVPGHDTPGMRGELVVQ